ncbi:hypothetical protein KR018_003658 [Drosophila ironensis]|nr:hypothetical protein KR018_003658 [Drosophila ironensis]
MKTSSMFEFTNVQCTPLDLKFNDFEYCFLKSFNRSYKYLSLKVKLYQIPITKVKVNFVLLKRFNGYKPFLYNITLDACKALKHSKFNPIFGWFHGLFSNHSNMHHTCPYDHDLIVDKLPVDHINEHFTKVLPFPTGDYLFQSEWLAYGLLRSIVKVYGTLS